MHVDKARAGGPGKEVGKIITQWIACYKWHPHSMGRYIIEVFSAFQLEIHMEKNTKKIVGTFANVCRVGELDLALLSMGIGISELLLSRKSRGVRLLGHVR